MGWKRWWKCSVLVIALSMISVLLMSTAVNARGISDITGRLLLDPDCWDEHVVPGTSAPPYGLGQPVQYDNWCDPIYTS